jgi:hypothetical protein
MSKVSNDVLKNKAYLCRFGRGMLYFGHGKGMLYFNIEKN